MSVRVCVSYFVNSNAHRRQSESMVNRTHINSAQSIFLEYHPSSSNITRCQVPSRVRAWYHDSAGDIIQLLAGFEDNSSFDWPEDGSVARSRRPQFEGQTKLLLSEKPVCNSYCFVIHLHLKKKFTFSTRIYPLDDLNILVCQVQESGRRFDIVTSISRDSENQWK